MKIEFRALLLACLCTASIAAPAQAASVARVGATFAQDLLPAKVAIGGRIAIVPGSPGWNWQWPGLYFETAFAGKEAFFEVGPGATILRIDVDGRTAATLAKPTPGLYRVSGLADHRPHILRIQATTENQAGPNRFDGILLPLDSQPLPPPLRERRIEFIGDSHTVGYGNLSVRRECSEAEVWAMTDNTRAYGPMLASRFGADYRVNAISGRGVVRNYDGMDAPTLPQAYPFALFDGRTPVADDGWQPQVVVVALGTNDFSTPLHASERWSDRASLRADYEATYADFLRSLRARYPAAYLLVWSTDLHGGEIRTAASRVVDALSEAGETRIGFVPVTGLAMDGCHAHPSLRDHAAIAAALGSYLDAQPQAWPGPTDLPAH